MTERRARRGADLLASYGTTASEIRELLAYNRNVFDRSAEQELPLPAEPPRGGVGALRQGGRRG